MQFRGHACIYCLTNPSTPTGDHIFARKFFLEHQRDNLPKAPCCETCGNEKAKLEVYLMEVLPFGGRHADAATNLETMVPRRLAKNRRTHRALARGHSRVWVRERSGVLVRRLTVPVDVGKLEKLFSYVAKGLMWHHWKVTLDADCFIEVHLPMLAAQRHFITLLQGKAAARARENLGNGTFAYVGAQGIDNPQISVWEFAIYGGIEISGGSRSTELISRIYAMTGPLHVQERAERRFRARAYIIRP